MKPGVQPPIGAVRAAVGRALDEDLTPLGDVTSALLPAGVVGDADFVVRTPGVLAGVSCATEAFVQVDSTVVVDWAATDGDEVDAKQVIGHVAGPLASILTSERTALNFLGHLSGIATFTHELVVATGGNAVIWDTRKTTPGLRTLEKAAVRAGGGANHRGNLSDWVLLKDNHLTVLGIEEAVRLARVRWPARTVHVECDSLDQVDQALRAGADALLLDNMTPDEVRAAVALANDTGERRPLLEVSGGITRETVRAYAQTGADCISIGAITNSAPVLDIGLDIEVSP
ncbi:MAG TPA: carboxylating nicotinate-nucleotide diphosphorylase [Acidimicrobiales bacterium]|nr:carboxylating nicotinate-nucleotide diphosphorylase [Acidimicrobiales bacterium]